MVGVGALPSFLWFGDYLPYHFLFRKLLYCWDNLNCHDMITLDGLQQNYWTLYGDKMGTGGHQISHLLSS
jgi:hypothetical protein